MTLGELEDVGIPTHLWYSATQAALWECLPTALVDGVKCAYTTCESTKEEGATKPKGYGFDDWEYLGKGTLAHAGVWRGECKKKTCVEVGGYE